MVSQEGFTVNMSNNKVLKMANHKGLELATKQLIFCGPLDSWIKGFKANKNGAVEAVIDNG